MNGYKLVDRKFFNRDDVVAVARDLIGKFLLSGHATKSTGGIITETEAYAGEVDRASHAFAGRRTQRTEIMYSEAGTLYVYLCYGIHSMLNIVSNKKDIPHAILIRSIFPVIGLDLIRKQRGQKTFSDLTICSGPGNLTKGLGVSLVQNGTMINQGAIQIQDRNLIIPEGLIHA